MSSIATVFTRSRKAQTGTSLLRPSVLLAFGALGVTVSWALVPGLFTSYDPIANVGPSLQAPNAEHFFGTDSTGRDVLSRVIYGARETLTGALMAVAVGFLVGTAMGVLSGSSHRSVDEVLMRIVDVLLAIPSLLLSLSVIILLGYGTVNVAIAVGITSIAAFARLSRSQVVQVSRSDFVEAAYGSGGSFGTVLWRHILPNSLTPVLALAALQFGSAILQISTLGFLGYGAPPPTPEWGLMIAESRDFVATAWWLTTLPGLVLVITVLSTNRLSYAIQARRNA
ncbi:ABC transporter permease [Nesterenkonia salmonea]|uniref:ABC transporter permease n=1 Tax=Nesterenkonia salmonea TaxID=1804987 RepID=A0A5R9BA83_9MICC|nr:ABC transporter permease [Nesterenkonia salmonea]TLP94872.1 ABC transporter permease [Nesterenkonia salmonea]